MTCLCLYSESEKLLLTSACFLADAIACYIINAIYMYTLFEDLNVVTVMCNQDLAETLLFLIFLVMTRTPYALVYHHAAVELCFIITCCH